MTSLAIISFHPSTGKPNPAIYEELKPEADYSVFFLYPDEIITLLEELAAERIAIYTKEDAEVLRLSSVANTPEEEARFRGVPARAVWC